MTVARALLVPAIPVILTACALPPRVEDRSTPSRTFLTFRSALARGEHENEYACMTRNLRDKLGLGSRKDWKEARTVVLTQRHLLVRGIRRARVLGEPARLGDGRVRLRLRFPFGKHGTLHLKRLTVLRAYLDGRAEPHLFTHLPGLELQARREGLLVSVPAAAMEFLEEALQPGQAFARLEVAREWFLDDFSAAGETPGSLRSRLARKGRTK